MRIDFNSEENFFSLVELCFYIFKVNLLGTSEIKCLKTKETFLLLKQLINTGIVFVIKLFSVSYCS